jgi:hypothetical protein
MCGVLSGHDGRAVRLEQADAAANGNSHPMFAVEGITERIGCLTEGLPAAPKNADKSVNFAAKG